MQWAVQEGANVISMSLGIDFPGIQKRLMMRLKPEPATSMALEGYRTNVQLFERMAALVSAWAPFGQATIIVAASGNESKRPEYQIAAAPPAVSSGFMCVAALDQNLKVATFSNTGVNVSGPGVGILSAKPGGGFQTMSGTSMATPHVAGVAALWAQKLKSINALSPGFLFSQVQAQATQANLQGYDFFDMGSGLVRAPQKLSYSIDTCWLRHQALN